MNRFQTLIAGLGLVAIALPAAASAAPWQSVNARQARLDARIDQGIRSGALTRGEAMRLRPRLVIETFARWTARELDLRREGASASELAEAMEADAPPPKCGEVFSRKETLDLIQAYYQLDERPRRRLLDLAKSLHAGDAAAA